MTHPYLVIFHNKYLYRICNKYLNKIIVFLQHLHKMARISDDTDLHYTVLTQEQLMTELMDTIAQVQDIVELPPTSCRALLAHFKWDKDRMLEA